MEGGGTWVKGMWGWQELWPTVRLLPYVSVFGVGRVLVRPRGEGQGPMWAGEAGTEGCEVPGGPHGHHSTSNWYRVCPMKH